MVESNPIPWAYIPLNTSTNFYFYLSISLWVMCKNKLQFYPQLLPRSSLEVSHKFTISVINYSSWETM